MRKLVSGALCPSSLVRAMNPVRSVREERHLEPVALRKDRRRRSLLPRSIQGGGLAFRRASAEHWPSGNGFSGGRMTTRDLKHGPVRRMVLPAVGAAGLALVTAPALAERAAGGGRGLSRSRPRQPPRRGAKREGELMVYRRFRGRQQRPHGRLREEARGQGEGLARRVGGLLRRTLAEIKGRRFEVDVVLEQRPRPRAMHREKVLQEVDVTVPCRPDPQADSAHREWVAKYINVFVQAYNTTS